MERQTRWGDRPYYSLNEHLKQRFGEKIYKLALDGGMTCPNRDGTLGTGGCIFCSEGGSGDFAERRKTSVTQQIEDAKARVARKISSGKYIAYFQSYTNTYAPIDYLETLFTEAIRHPDVAVLSVATRPDCLPPAVLDLLEQLNHRKPVWVELGLQTTREATARLIRRGYPLDCFTHAWQQLHARRLPMIAHVILGLPGETPADMFATIRYLAGQGTGFPADGVKLQLLHVLRGTDLAELYRQGAFSVLSLEEYLPLLAGCVRRLAPSTVVHRLTGDGPKKLLIAPLWSGDKKRVLNAIQRYFREEEVQQGALADKETNGTASPNV